MNFFKIPTTWSIFLFLPLPLLWRTTKKKETPSVQGWLHSIPNHPLSSLQHQLKVPLRQADLTSLGARQISACKWRLREHEVGGEEMNIPNLGYVATSPSLLHSLKREWQKAGAWGEGEELLHSTGTWSNLCFLVFTERPWWCHCTKQEAVPLRVFWRGFFASLNATGCLSPSHPKCTSK